MFMPRFSSPYNVLTATQPCTRASLSGHDSQPSSRSIDDVPNEVGIKWLEEHFRESLDYSIPNYCDGQAGRDAEDERLPGEKRRDLKDDETLPDTVYDFRLLSSDAMPRKISLKPKLPISIRLIESEYEDAPKWAEERRRRAKEVAVDFEWVIRQSRMSSQIPSDDRNLTTVIALNISSPLSAPRSSTNPRLFGMRFFNAAMWKSPHELKRRTSCPLISVRTSEGCERRRKRKRGKSAIETQDGFSPLRGSFFKAMRGCKWKCYSASLSQTLKRRPSIFGHTQND